MKLQPDLLDSFQKHLGAKAPLHLTEQSGREGMFSRGGLQANSDRTHRLVSLQNAGQVGYPKPFFFVFHGGSGSEKEDIEKAPPAPWPSAAQPPALARVADARP